MCKNENTSVCDYTPIRHILVHGQPKRESSGKKEKNANKRDKKTEGGAGVGEILSMDLL